MVITLYSKISESVTKKRKSRQAARHHASTDRHTYSNFNLHFTILMRKRVRSTQKNEDDNACACM